MNLSTRQLRIFSYLAQTLSFSRTAEHFAVTQPTLSKLMREIETSVGVRLFERTTRKVALTVNGDALLPVARRVLSEFDAGMTELDQVVRHRTHRLAIAALPTLAATQLPDLVAALQVEVPDALVRVHDVVNDEAIDLLRARRVDIALISIDVMQKDLVYTELFREPFVFLARRESPVAMKKWSTKGIRDLRVISMPIGTGTRQTVEIAYQQQGLAFRPILELKDLYAIARFVRVGCGVALLPRTAAELVLSDDLVFDAVPGAPERVVGIVTRREMELPVLAARMVGMLREQNAEGVAGQ